MADPSVTKEFKRLIAPDFAALGFTADGTKCLRRVVGDIFQGVFLHVETRIRREFLIEYCAFLITVPHAHYSLEHGGRFPVGSRGTWYRADTQERLDQSMTRVRANVPDLLDWFRESESLDGFLSTFSVHCAKQPPALVCNGHASLTFACGCASAGDFRSARSYAEKALSEFERTLASFRAEYPNASHPAPTYIERAQSLISAIDGSTTNALLAEWRALTTVALKLHR